MRSISHRLTLWYAILVTASIAVVLFVARFYLESSLVQGIDLLNTVEFEEIRNRMEETREDGGGVEALMEAIRDHAELDAALYFFQVGLNHEDVIYRSSNLGPRILPEEVHGVPHVTVYDEELGTLRSAEFNYAGMDIHIASSLESAETVFRNYNLTSVYICLAAFVLSLAVGYCLSRLAMNPIATIQATARRITATNFNERITVPNTEDEIARMAQLLNEMLDRLEESYNQVKRFTAEASHEFRTPLSIIRLHAERLLTSPELSELERTTALTEQMEEIERLNKLIDDLLLIAKADAGVMTLDLSTVDLRSFINDFRNDAELLAENAGVRFETGPVNAATWEFDPGWMRRVLLNLLSNALEVTPGGGTVRLSVTREQEELVLSVCDEGPGIPEADLDRIFDRFERLGRNQDGKGNGLGLAICQSIVHRHGGSIMARNRIDGQGLEVIIRLPDPGCRKA